MCPRAPRVVISAVCSLLAALLIAIPVSTASAGQAGEQRLPASSPDGAIPVAKRSLGSMLRSDGTVRTGRAVSGTYNPRGYRMVLGPHGLPHFVQATSTTESTAGTTATREATAASPNPADVNWDDRFELPGVQNSIFGSEVDALVVNGTDIYVGGVFTFAGNGPHSYVLRWDGRRWNDLSGGVSGAPSGRAPRSTRSP